MYTVYKHTTPSGKVYIGITKKKPEHRWENGSGYKKNKHFYRAILKYRWENIKHEILETGLTKEQACAKEIELIAKYDSTNPDKGYNQSTGGECGTLGTHHSDETRRKQSESLKRAYLDPELRRKIGESHKGVNNPWYGKHHSAETRQKISESLKGRIAWNKGQKGVQHYHYSSDTRLKMSESRKGTHLSIETRKKIGESRKKTVICVETGALYSSITEAAESIGVSFKTISNVLHGRQKTAGGYHWKYAEKQ